MSVIQFRAHGSTPRRTARSNPDSPPTESSIALWRCRRGRRIMRAAGEGAPMNSRRMRDVVALSTALAALWPSQQFNRVIDAQARASHGFTVDDILSMPQPANLVASPAGSTIAWPFDEPAVRNI